MVRSQRELEPLTYSVNASRDAAVLTLFRRHRALGGGGCGGSAAARELRQERALYRRCLADLIRSIGLQLPLNKQLNKQPNKQPKSE